MKSFINSIQAISESAIQIQPSINFGRVIRYYENTVTVETKDGVLENIKCINVPVIGSPCILIPVEEEFVCIPNKVDESRDIDLDIDLNMDLMDNGYLKVCAGIIKKEEA